jgi:hypothetical protein
MNTPDSLTIKLNTIKLLINKGPDYIEFDADDIMFIEGFYSLIEQFQLKQIQYQQKMDGLDFDATTPGGLPLSAGETIAAMKDVCLFAHAKIDEIFGKGTSQKLFGSSLAFGPIEQFFVGITPYIKAKRSQRLQAFLPPKHKPRRRKP